MKYLKKITQEVSVSVKKAQSTAAKARAKKKKKRILIYEYCISFIALVGTALAVIDLLQGLEIWQQYMEWGILITLTVDYCIRLWMAKDKKKFFVENIFHLIAIIPFNSVFRVLRVTKLAKLLRLSIIGAFPKKAFKKVKKFLNTNGLKNMLFFTGLAILFGAIGIMYTEGMNLGNAVWWAFVTATTVGYGDLSPQTSLGRLIAAVLMIFGIGLIGSITSTITSYFLKIDNGKNYKEENLELIKKKIDHVDELSDEDIDNICKILKTLNK